MGSGQGKGVGEEKATASEWVQFVTCCENLKQKWCPDAFDKNTRTELSALAAAIDSAIKKVDFVEAVLHMDKEALPIHLISSVVKSSSVKILENPLSSRPRVVLKSSDGLVAELLATDLVSLTAFVATNESPGPLSRAFVRNKLLRMSDDQLSNCLGHTDIPHWLLVCLCTELSLTLRKPVLQLVRDNDTLRNLALSTTVEAIKNGTKDQYFLVNPSLAHVLDNMGSVRESDLRFFLDIVTSHPERAALFKTDAGFFIRRLKEKSVPHYDVLIPLAFLSPCVVEFTTVNRYGGADAARLVFETIRSNRTRSSENLPIYLAILEEQVVHWAEIESAITEELLAEGPNLHWSFFRAVHLLSSPIPKFIEDAALLLLVNSYGACPDISHAQVFRALRRYQNFQSGRIQQKISDFVRGTPLHDRELYFLCCCLDVFPIPASLAPALERTLIFLSSEPRSTDIRARDAALLLLYYCSPSYSGNINGSFSELIFFLADKPSHPLWYEVMKIHVPKLLKADEYKPFVTRPILNIVQRTFAKTTNFVYERLAIFALRYPENPLTFSDIHLVVSFVLAFLARRNSLKR